ncbi:MAG: PadR family transcriptional regulator [Candidatus Bathyarchaeia archaeon]
MFKAGFFRGRGGISPVQFLILLQLKKQSKYGYEILRALRKQFGDVWEPKTGTIYPALRRLEARGFVRTEVKGEKEFYSLTEKGEGLLRDAGEYLGIDLEFADKYYNFVSRRIPPLLRANLIERIKEGLSRQDEWPPIFLHLLLNEITDEKAKLEILKKLREFLQTRLILIDERIQKLEGKK